MMCLRGNPIRDQDLATPSNLQFTIGFVLSFRLAQAFQGPIIGPK